MTLRRPEVAHHLYPFPRNPQLSSYSPHPRRVLTCDERRIAFSSELAFPPDRYAMEPPPHPLQMGNNIAASS